MTRHYELTLKVAYDTSEIGESASPEQVDRMIRRNLLGIADRAAGEGQMSGETELLVDVWSAEVRETTKR